MLKRIITAVVALALLIPALIFGGVWVAWALFAVVCAVSIYELLGCCGLKKEYLISIPSIVGFPILCCLPALIGYAFDYYGREGLRTAFKISNLALLLFPLAFVLFLIIAVLKHKNLDIEKLSMFACVAIYVTAGFGSLSYLRVAFGKNSIWTLWFVFAVSWMTDTFAYFTGMAFGKKKLCPEISPKKTVAGAIGGTVFGTLAGVTVMWVFVGEPLLGLVALPLSVISQFGDLAASLIKRKFGVKDYGKLFPGHGGVLDRFDSVIAVAICTAIAASVYSVFIK